MEEIEEMSKDRKAKAESHILEMVGDIPDAEIKPPENILFICKLNPVTSSEDLEIIFSRFGTILSCEVIRDQKTGDSLCYAFIEYENVDNCEKAYFKMDNVLIDDRRIHVDFSQSVAKMKWDMFKKAKETKKQTNQTKLQLKDKYVEKNEYDFVFDDEEDSGNRRQYQESSSRKHSHQQKHKHRDSSPRQHSSSKYDQRADSSRKERHNDDKRYRHYERHSDRDDGRRSKRDNYRDDTRNRSDKARGNSSKDYLKDRDTYHRRRSPRR
ncbi:Peptidyl-prolyl cis-trans isomerase-like 4 [Trichoplax sp. H2]|nr:Peptidyl-prolyl cis-trans isomerase-like 4 [Trichoplax sp. H2]|eukprot:RDD42376.1 Peptidyl-prolyl cis-trans isomerase-like 4 [Trichoplax sp. H2]